MAQTMRGCLTACSQIECAAEPENSLSIMQLEEQVDAEEGEVIVNYEPDVDYDPEGPDPNTQPVTQEEEEENFDAEHVKMELLYQGTLRKWTMHHQVHDWIWHVHAA